jgi:hemerythrin-like domain-containing protein
MKNEYDVKLCKYQLKELLKRANENDRTLDEEVYYRLEQALRLQTHIEAETFGLFSLLEKIHGNTDEEINDFAFLTDHSVPKRKH